MAKADHSGNLGAAEETLRPASLIGSPEYDDAYLDSKERPSRSGRRMRSPVDDSNVLLDSAEYDDKTLDASPRPARSGIVQFVRTPTSSPPKQSPEERWEARAEEVYRVFEELRQSNDISQLRAFVEERYYDAVRYEVVLEELKEIILEYASQEQKREVQENEFHPVVMIRFIKELLELCRLNRVLLQEQYEEKLQDWTSKFEREQKRQILRDRHQRYYDVEKRTREDDEHMRDIARAVYTVLMQGMQRAFFSRMQSLTPDPDQVHFAVEEWIRTTDRILEQRKEEVNSLIQKGEFMELRRHRQSAEIDRLEEEIADLKREEMEKRIHVQLMRQRLEDLENNIEELNQEYHNRKFGRGIQQATEETGASGASTPALSTYGTPEFQSTPLPGKTFKKTFKKIFTKPSKKARSLFGTPTGSVTPDMSGVRRADTSPEYYEEYPEEFEESYRITDTPPGRYPHSRRPSPLSQTFILTSPKREEPVFVNIDVEPSNLIDTENGECFVCDIKLDVQPGGLLPQLQQASGGVSPYELDTSTDRSLEMSESPIVKGRHMGRRNIPPDITPTSTRRKHELFTPKGIFKRGQVNIRRIPGKHPISELPWSPTYLPEDARSPVTSLSSPLRWSDRSVSWEKKYESDYGLSPSSSPVIKEPTYKYHSPEFPLSSSSPIIKGRSYGYSSPGSELSSSLGTSYRYQSPVSDRSSPSPMIKGPGYKYQLPAYDRSSPSPMIQRPDYRYRSPDSDRSSASPTFVERFERYPSPVASPLFATPPSGYLSGLEGSRTPKSGSSPHFVRFQDPFNRRMQLGEMIESSSYASHTPRTPQRGLSPHVGSNQDPFNRRMQLDEMIGPSRYAEQTPGTHGRASDSNDSERGYLEDSPDSSLLNEARFLN